MLVTFAGGIAPHGAGDTRLVPDDVAQDLLDKGEASKAVPWPAAEAASAPKRPERPTLRPSRSGAPRDQRTAR